VPRHRLLADRRVRLVLLALVASGAADGLLPVALSFAVLQVAGSAGKLGLVLACQSAVALVLTPAGGLAGDRFPRRRVLIMSLAVRMAVAVVLAATLMTGSASFGLLLIMAAVYGCADGFFGPASSALLPDIVPLEHLARANAVAGGSTSSVRIAAPATAGLLVAAFGPGSAFALQAAVLAIAAGCLIVARSAPDNRTRSRQEGPLRQLRAGWTEFARLRWLWLLTGQWSVFCLIVLAPVAVLGPAIALRHLGGAPAWGLISSCLSLGAVGGQVIGGRIRPPGRPGLVLACLVPVMTGQALALGLAAPIAVVALATAISGVAIGVQAVIFPTAIQAAIPPEVLARVTSIDLLASEAGQPIGYALAGPLAAAAGARTVLASGAIAMFIASSAFPLLRSLRAEIRRIEPAAAVTRSAARSPSPASPDTPELKP
jgi:predicted MFS family arabinose efflux permease